MTIIKPTFTLLVSIILIGGCSTYKGHKLPPDGGLMGEATGIPFQMVRPEYTLKITPKADDETTPFHTLEVAYIPDPTQRFTLTLDPAFLTDGTFNLNLGPNSNLADGSVVLSEQITPFVTSLGTFASSLVGVLPLVADQGTPFSIIRDQVAVECQSSIGKNIVERMKMLKVYGSRLGEDGEEFFVRHFHYLDNSELECLEKVRDKLKQNHEDIELTFIQQWEESKKTFLDQYSDEDAKRLVKSLQKDVDQRDKEKLKKLEEEYEQRVQADPTLETDERFKAEQKLHMAARQIGGIARTSKESEIVQSFIDMSDAVWRARHVLHLERGIERAEADYLRHPEGADERRRLEDKIVKLRLEWAYTIGKAADYDRLLDLNQFIAKIRQKTVQGGKTWATAEYTQAREERDILLKEITDSRGTIVAINTPSTPSAVTVKTQDIVNLTRATPAFIKESTTTGWANTPAGIDAPEYVIVLEPLLESHILKSTNSMGDTQ